MHFVQCTIKELDNNFTTACMVHLYSPLCDILFATSREKLLLIFGIG